MVGINTLEMYEKMSEEERRLDSLQAFFAVAEAEKYGKKQNDVVYITDKKHRKERKTRLVRRIFRIKKHNRRKTIASLPYYKPSRGYFVNDDDKTHLKYPKNSRRQRWCKRQTSKTVRRQRDVPNGNGYRKYYWYNVY